MILIIEGADLVGKSTLARRLTRVKGWPIVKLRWTLRGDPETETKTIARSTIEFLDATHPNAIFDRCYFSWWAYAPPLGYPVDYMPHMIASFRVIDDARLILLTASEDAILRRYERKPHHRYPLAVILEANQRYPSLLPLLPENLPRLHINTSDVSADEVFAQADTFINAESGSGY